MSQAKQNLTEEQKAFERAVNKETLKIAIDNIDCGGLETCGKNEGWRKEEACYPCFLKHLREVAENNVRGRGK